MLVIGEELDACHAARVLLKVRDELTGADLPDANLALHAAGADELAALCEADRSDTTLVCIVNLPELLAVIDTVRTDTSITPAADDDLVGEDGTQWVDTALAGRGLLVSCDAPGGDGVGVGVPEAHSSILTARNELVADAWHEPRL